MMPRPPSKVLRRLGTGGLLVIVILAAVALPARHVLVPPWPGLVDEILTQDRPGEVERLLLPAGSPGDSDSNQIARTRPLTLWRLETDERVLYAWLAGVRDENGLLMPSLPHWMQPPRVDGPLPDGIRLVLMTATRETVEIDGARIARMYHPNGLSVVARAGLWKDRLGEGWQGISGDARMAPSGR